MKNQLQFLKDMGAPWNFGMNDPQKFMEKLNWKTVLLSQAGDYAPTRWPFPVIPMSVSNAPRGFFVEAVKV